MLYMIGNRLFGIFRARGDLSAPGPKIIAGKLEPPADELTEAVAAMRQFCLPQAGNIYNLEYRRLYRDECPHTQDGVTPALPAARLAAGSVRTCAPGPNFPSCTRGHGESSRRDARPGPNIEPEGA